MNDGRWTLNDIFVPIVFGLVLVVIGFAIWWGQTGNWKNQPTLAAYIQKVVPGAYFVRSGNCQMAMDSSGQSTEIAICGRSVEAVVTHSNEKVVSEIVTDLSGPKAWKHVGPLFSTPIPGGSWATTLVESGTDITVQYNASNGEYLLIDTR